MIEPREFWSRRAIRRSVRRFAPQPRLSTKCLRILSLLWLHSLYLSSSRASYHLVQLGMLLGRPGLRPD